LFGGWEVWERPHRCRLEVDIFDEDVSSSVDALDQEETDDESLDRVRFRNGHILLLNQVYVCG